MRRGYWFLAVAIVLLAGTTLATNLSKAPIRNFPIRGGSDEPVYSSTQQPSAARAYYRANLDEMVGTPYQAGETYYDMQHNGTAGKMLGVDDLGYVHLSWMKGINPPFTGARHVNYNVFDPTAGNFVFFPDGAEGVRINSSTRAGYVTMAVLPSGWAFPSFHEVVTGVAGAHASAAMDYQRRFGAFNATPATICYRNGAPMEIIWPKIAVGRDSVIHMVSTQNPTGQPAGHPQEIFYSRGVPTWDIVTVPEPDTTGVEIVWDDFTGQPGGCAGFLHIDTVMVIAPTVVTSKTSDRVAIVWAKCREPLTFSAPFPSQLNNDLYYMMSEDGGLNWLPEVNITNFAYPDLDCVSQDTAVCNRDTFRVYTDCEAIFDREDDLHVAFAAVRMYELSNTYWPWRNDIFHWDSENQVYSAVATLDPESVCWTLGSDGLGAWQLPIQRPQMALDPTNGYIYMSYQWYDPQEVSEAGWPMADAMVTVSTDDGVNWAEATNVTDTHWRPDDAVDSLCYAAPADSCVGERDITLAERITYENGAGFLHMEYVIDRDAGTEAQEEGASSLSPVIYQKINVNDIPTTPLHDINFPVMHADSTGWPGFLSVRERHTTQPASFALYQNYPNPFNPSTQIQFDLARASRVTLKVFNVTGQEVATLIGNELVGAGAKVITFDGQNLASGIYVYRLEVDGMTMSKKMVLMK